MPPKFQSSFIPKGPAAFVPEPGAAASVMPRRQPSSLLSFIGTVIFVLTLLAAVGVYGYQYYIDFSIKRMGQLIEESRTNFSAESVGELLDLDHRITSTRSLLNSHQVISPAFRFLESVTPRSVRYSEFNYSETSEGYRLVLKGEARSYGALALASGAITKNESIKNPLFSDIKLDDSGNVGFTLAVELEPNLISYLKQIEKTGAGIPTPAGINNAVLEAFNPLATTTAPSRNAATSTRNN